jgi:hypothetical protein
VPNPETVVALRSGKFAKQKVKSKALSLREDISAGVDKTCFSFLAGRGVGGSGECGFKSRRCMSCESIKKITNASSVEGVKDLSRDLQQS